MIGRSGPQLRGSIQGSAKTALTLAMLIAATAAGASVLTKSYSFTSDSVMFAKDTVADTVFDVITMSTCGADDRLVGAPQLPQRAVSFLIPSNAKMDSVVATATAETLSGSYNPVPIQPLQDTSTAFFPPSTYLYEAGYPRDFVDGATDGSMSNYRMVSFNLRPVRLLPNGQLVKAQQLTVYVYYTLSAGFSGVAQTRRSRFCQEELSHTVAAIVENPEHTTDFGVSVPIDTPESLLVVSPGPSPSGNYVDCVIVTLTQDSSEYERYAEFLTQRGIVTTVRTLAWIDGQYQGADDAACVRAFIKDANIQWGTLFVILAGWPTGLNTGLPTRLIPSGTNEGVQGWEGLATTDVYFADLKGSWDDNNNGVYMEPPVNELSALCFTDGLHGCGVDPRDNYVMVTNDGGTDWSPSSWPTGFGYDVADMDFADVGHGACAGWKPMPGTKYSQTTVWTTADGGSHWYERTGSEIEGRLNGIYFVNAYNGWAVGWNHYCSGIILHTTNGGTDWTQVQSPLTHGGLYDVKFSASGQLGWITSHWTSHGNIIRTTNAGASWDTVHLPGVYPNPRSVSFADSNFGWVTGSTQDAGCAVWATTDGGASWQAPTHPGTGEVGADIVAKCTNGTSYDVWVATPTHIYHGDQSGNWTEQYSSIDTILRHIQFLDDALHGWASGPFQGYLYTSDGGDTWQHEIPGFFWKDSSALCMMPDVFVGRLPSLPGDGSAQTVIDKLIAYQATPELTHLQKIKLCAGAGTHGSSDLRGLNALTDSSWLQNLEITKIWDLSSGGQYPFHREYVLAGLNDGSQFITHDYHGGDLYWQTGDDV
ncbi:MAG: C25 family cysteine peptidase, partial [candidate division WOR-3 bacterium]|nr:C25 family cysteine peptidase [candidate division WOR-3 bacterium]